MQPSDDLHALARAMFKDAWNQWLAQARQALTSLKTALTKTETQIEQLLERIVEADNATVIRAYEVKLAKLEREKLLQAEKIANSGQPRHGFDELFELALRFLANPWNIWTSGDLTMRRMVLKLAFTGRLPYCRETGFSNPKKAFTFKVLGGIFR
ncbi:MAG: hypothetical protein AAF764_02575 [Pseudomonadota bacterium]